MDGGRAGWKGEGKKEREREFLLEPHNWTHISTLFISSLRNDGRGLRRSRGTKARHEGDAKRAKEREAKVVGVGSGEFPRRTLIACPTFSSREEEDHSKNSSNERLLEKLNLSKSLWSFRLRFYINSLPLNKSNKNSYSSSLCSLPLWITETTAVRRAGRANVSGPGRFKPRETSSKFSFPLLSPSKEGYRVRDSGWNGCFASFIESRLRVKLRMFESVSSTGWLIFLFLKFGIRIFGMEEIIFITVQ